MDTLPDPPGEAPADPPGPEEQAALLAAAARDRRNLPALMHLAERCLAAGEAARAAGIADEIAALAPGDPVAIRFQSGILAVAGRLAAALAAAEEAVRLAPAAGEARLHLAGLLIGQGQWREAVAHLLVHVESGEAGAPGWRLLSGALQQIGRTERALEAAERALLLDPQNREYQLHRAALLAARGRYGDALADLQEILRHEPGAARVWRMQSGIRAVLHDLPAALRDAERATLLDPADPEFAEHLALLRRSAGLGTGPAQARPPGAQAQAGQSPGLAATIDYWAPARRRRGSDHPPPRRRLSTALAEQARVVFALMLREIRTRFGHTRLGYFWAIMEPISHLLTLGTVFYLLNHGPAPIGDNLFLFYVTGLLPYLLFGHVAQEVMTALGGHGAVLQLPIVKRIDVLVSRSVLQLATEVFVAVVIFSLSALLGFQGMPNDPLVSVQAALCIWLIGTGIGALNLVIVEFFAAWESIFNAINRLLYFASGIYYSPIAMPDTVRDILVWNPVLQCVEWFRAGFYYQYDPHWLDRGYVLVWVAGSLVVGFAAERALRRHVAVAA